MIKIQNLNKYYGDVQILKNVDMEISKGEIFGIIGHSGAGKSTLLRCINGLEDYRDGSLTVEGQEVKDLTEKEIRELRKNLGMIFQHFSLLERKTVFENVALPLECFKYPKEEIEKKVHQVMEQLHKLPDLERLAELGIEEKLKNWHSLGAIDEDEILRRMELHLDELPENLRGDRKVILQLIEKRRRKIEQQLLIHHPEIVEHLKKSRERLEKRLEKQNPEAARKLHKWEEEIREKKEP